MKKREELNTEAIIMLLSTFRIEISVLQQAFELSMDVGECFLSGEKAFAAT